ncbi:MAG: TolC family protein [Planctomycetota bacterium]
MQWRTADEEAYAAIAERNHDARWKVDDYSIDLDPNSRYSDAYDPTRPPMPPDDPASQEYMKVVDGMEGWDGWLEDGQRDELENPAWRDSLHEYAEADDDGALILNVDSAMRLAYVRSPSHQNQLESLYLSALDVTRERFRFDTQFFGGYDARYVHTDDSDRVTLGKPFAGDPALQARRNLATGGSFIAGLANSFVFELAGDGGDSSTSIANFALLQPLLRGAGRHIALEQLTQAERTLLGNVRAYSQYRQGFYTQVAIGEVGVTGPRRFGAGTNVSVFSGQGGVNGFLGLLQRLQQIRNSEDNLSLQQRTLAQLEALLEAGLIDLEQVDQFRQNVETERSNILLSKNQYELSLDGYKTNTLGLPSDLPISLDDTMIRQFQLVSRQATALRDDLTTLQLRIGALPDNTNEATLQAVLSDLSDMTDRIRGQLDSALLDIQRAEDATPLRERSMTEDDKVQFQSDRQLLRENMATLEQQHDEASAYLVDLKDADDPLRGSVVLLGRLVRLVQGATLIQARARLEAITIESIELGSEIAYQIALDHRLDFMNARAALVDDWRLIKIRENALQSVVNVSVGGDIRTSNDNPVDFRGDNSSLSLGLEFDAPLTRLTERNQYRESLIDYQRSRRELIQSTDRLQLGLRVLLRDLKQQRLNLEIQRRAVAIAIRRVDLTQTNLYAPVAPPRPGQQTIQFGPTAAINLLSALSSLRNSQNSLLRVWLSYYAARMRLSRELGTMQLTDDGRWIDPIMAGAEGDSPPQPPLAPGPNDTARVELSDDAPGSPGVSR